MRNVSIRTILLGKIDYFYTYIYVILFGYSIFFRTFADRKRHNIQT